MSKKRDVTIKAFRKPDGTIDFEMLEDGTATDTLVFDKTKDKLKKSDDYDIHFTLVNEPGVACEFVTQKTKPGEQVMYIAKGSSTHIPPCPVDPMTSPLADFEVGQPKATTLVVKNKDKDVCYYKFALRFVDTATNKIEVFDPIYDNRNGGGGGISESWAEIGVAAFAGAAAAAMLATWGSEAIAPSAVVMGALAGGLVGMAVALLLGGLRG